MSLKFCCIASGSKGNCCYVSDGVTDILIDMGISATRVEGCLKVLDVNPDTARILVTHSHSDHVNGLKVFCKKHPTAKVICQQESVNAVAHAEGITPLVARRSFRVGDMTVSAIPVSHDVPCFGYTVSDGKSRVAVMTDVGKIGTEQLNALGACDIVMLEANHDIDRLNANPRYSAMLKARILSQYGHLSNNDCAAACAFLAAGGVKNFVLAHLSEENNDPELAVSTVENFIKDTGVSDVRVIAARQDAMSGLFEVC